MAAVGNLTGDGATFTAVQKEGVTLHNMPVVDEAHLSDKDHIVNNADQSGKRLGALITIVKAGAPVLLQAAGDAPTSKWIAVTKGATDITPA
ncbi:hypothetical protein vBVpaPMGD2_8 [Vibrio phage vB_VpaP_MGD2]|uniref:Uncharacterized protein n=1 Tax=Vibrio phage vB_VpaP_MGD2 TaxID=2565877 RepID=A0A6B7HX87_9CAUD|nr:hypothetical protein vBVpaPMGD2_8 [Vibrio phage vB_VpaP_MGD2]